MNKLENFQTTTNVLVVGSILLAISFFFLKPEFTITFKWMPFLLILGGFLIILSGLINLFVLSSGEAREVYRTIKSKEFSSLSLFRRFIVIFFLILGIIISITSIFLIFLTMLF